MEKRTKPETQINSKKTGVMEEYFQAKNGKELITADIVDVLERIRIESCDKDLSWPTFEKLCILSSLSPFSVFSSSAQHYKVLYFLFDLIENYGLPSHFQVVLERMIPTIMRK